MSLELSPVQVYANCIPPQAIAEDWESSNSIARLPKDLTLDGRTQVLGNSRTGK